MNRPPRPAARRKESLRQALTGLHTWGGLLVVWVLYAVFLTGTLTVFMGPITRWLTPELAAADAPPPSAAERAQTVALAQRRLQQVAPVSHFWVIELPAAAGGPVRLSWEDADEQAVSAWMSAHDGVLLAAADAPRRTSGGRHFMRMHYELQAGMAGLWVVGFCTMALLVALVSGVVIHKRIFRDFFTFRPGRGQRSWLDAHNAVGVLTLPFQLMIAYTGIVVFYATYLPAAMVTSHGSVEAYLSALKPRPPHRDETGIAAPVGDLSAWLRDAEQQLQRPVELVVVDHPGDSSASARFAGPMDESTAARRLGSTTGGAVLFDAVSGAVLHVVPPRAEPGGVPLAAQRVMDGLHFASFGGWATRWLYFLCGLAGTAMVASGGLLFAVKRRQRGLHEFGRHTPRAYRVVDVLNVATMAGLALACVAYLWANRLLPVGLDAARPAWELRVFFAVWLLALMHASLRPAPHAWAEQGGLLALLCLALPLLNAASTGSHLGVYALRGDGQRLGVEGVVLATGLLLVAALWRRRVRVRVQGL